MNSINKNCENCRYLIKYYAKTTTGKLTRYFGMGRCYNGNLHFKTRQKNVVCNLGCEFWEAEELQIEERRENIYKTIIHIQKLLEDISLILETDK